MSRPATRVIWLLVVAAMIGAPASAGATAKRGHKHRRLVPATITVLSGRADLISGGNALVSVTLPPRAVHRRVRISLGRRNVGRQFSVRSGRTLEGLLTGLRVGANLLSVRLPDGTGARITLTDHPLGGPVFSGPQVKPWTCQAGAVDALCDAPPRYTYVYESTDPVSTGFQPYDPAHPPSDVALTTTDQGNQVPFIVRVETGYEDRDQYQIATLFQPGAPWSWSRPQHQWNHKLLITHGASCDVDYRSGTAPSVTSYNPANLLGLPLQVPAGGPLGDSAQYALAHGFAVMSTALDNSGHNCDVVTQAESLMMAKEHLIKAYGTLRYTIGAGCSGGSLAQQWIANAYPGIYQGILPTCSFPDAWSSATQVMDYHLLLAYLQHPSHWGPGVVWLPTQSAPVEGNALPLDAILSDAGFFGAIVPTHACGGISAQQRYQPQTNPAGVRCSISDFAINVFAPRPKSVWSANERELGHGFAGVPVDNVGVQYGLSLLRSGEISPAQFADLNARIGGLDIDINPTARRIAADPTALANAYRSGMINETNNLGQTAIIDCRGPDPGAAHDSYRAFAVRARLDREHGTHANQVIWEGPAPIIGDTDCTVQSLIAMDRWLGAVAQDHRARSLPAKVIADRPADVSDECFDGTGQRLSFGLCPAGVVPVYGTPRTVAGDAITTDANKCRLKPLSRSDYPVKFTAGQWTELQTAFPSGVCDFTKPGVDQQGTVPWMTYQNSAGRVIYGGRPLGPPPRSRAFGAPRRRPRRAARSTARASSRLSARTVTIGRSVDHRRITAQVLGPDSAPRKLLVVGCIHGNECAGLRILRALRGRPPAGVQLWLVGELNPDGTAAGTRQNADGVDLNRNFPYQWQRVTDPTYFSGPAALSEPESRAAVELIRRIKPAVTVWYHQHEDLVDMAGGDRGVARRYAQISRLRATCLAFLPGTAPAWSNHALPGTTSFVVELPAGPVGNGALSAHLRAVRAIERGQRSGSRTSCAP